MVFDQAEQLQRLYPKFLRHAISSFQSPDVLRFLGRKVPQNSGKAHAGFEGEVSSRVQQRPEGVRIPSYSQWQLAQDVRQGGQHFAGASFHKLRAPHRSKSGKHA